MRHHHRFKKHNLKKAIAPTQTKTVPPFPRAFIYSTTELLQGLDSTRPGQWALTRTLKITVRKQTGPQNKSWSSDRYTMCSLYQRHILIQYSKNSIRPAVSIYNSVHESEAGRENVLMWTVFS